MNVRELWGGCEVVVGSMLGSCGVCLGCVWEDCGGCLEFGGSAEIFTDTVQLLVTLLVRVLHKHFLVCSVVQRRGLSLLRTSVILHMFSRVKLKECSCSCAECSFVAAIPRQLTTSCPHQMRPSYNAIAAAKLCPRPRFGRALQLTCQR